MTCPGVRTIADVSTVAANEGYSLFAHAAEIHQEWRCGSATIFVRDDLAGSVSVLVRCPGWVGDARLPAGMSLATVAAVAAEARDQAARWGTGRAS